MSTKNPPLSNNLPEIREQFTGTVARSVQAVAFWLAVALPFLYVPLVLNGFSGQEVVAFVALLAVNVVSLVVSHDYHREES